MRSPEKTQDKRVRESLVSVKALKNFWPAHRGSFFDQLIAVKSGVWADCPNTLQVYFKAIYFKRNGIVTRQSYSLVDARRIIFRLDRELVRDIENYESVSINCAIEIAEVDSGTVLVNESDRSIVEFRPVKIFLVKIMILCQTCNISECFIRRIRALYLLLVRPGLKMIMLKIILRKYL